MRPHVTSATGSVAVGLQVDLVVDVAPLVVPTWVSLGGRLRVNMHCNFRAVRRLDFVVADFPEISPKV